MSGPSTQQLDALAKLFGELNVASEIAFGKPLVRETPGRSVPGYYKALHTGTPLSGGKKRRLQGGGICEDNLYVKLAVESAIILGAVSATAGAGYAGKATIEFYMNAYHLNDATKDAVHALYDSIQTWATTGMTGASAIYLAFREIFNTTAGSVGTTSAGLGRVMLSSGTGAAIAAPAFLAGRYFNSANDVHADIQATVNALQAQYNTLSEWSGRVTRSLTEKKEELAAQISAAQASLSASAASASASATSSVASAKAAYLYLKRSICWYIDALNSGVQTALGALPRPDISGLASAFEMYGRMGSAAVGASADEWPLALGAQRGEGDDAAGAGQPRSTTLAAGEDDDAFMRPELGGKKRRMRKTQKIRKDKRLKKSSKKSRKGSKKSNKRRQHNRR